MCLRKLLVVLGIVVATATTVKATTIVDFEDLSLPDSESSWSGNYPSDGQGGTGEYTSFKSEDVAFNNYSDGDWDYWEGFGYSNTSDTTTPGYENDLSAYTGTGYNAGDDIYGVGYEFNSTPTITLPQPGIVEGGYFTNTTYAALAMRDGYFNAKKFGGDSGGDPDWFCLTITGKDLQGQITSEPVEFYLADYRDPDNSQDYIVDSWEYVDLSSLGEVKTVEFTLSSSDVGDQGINTPTYFAMDNLVVPEPSVIFLLTLGGLFLRRKR